MATITSLGIGSGLDINSMVTQLVALERRPLEAMRTQASKLQTQVSSYGKMQSLFSTLQDRANALNASTLWNRSTAKSGDETSVMAIGDSGAAAGNYSVSVQKLAKGQTAVSETGFAAATDTVGAGTVRIEIGTWGGIPLGFSGKLGAASVDVSISATDSLSTVRDKINAANAGVTASIVTDANGSRLALRSTATGVENGFRVTTTDVGDGSNNDNAGLSRLAYDPAGGATGMRSTQTAANAEATVNGIAVSSPSNELKDTLEGVTLTLRKVTTADVSVDVSTDRDSVEKAVRDFADSYNALSTYISAQTRYDDTTKVAGTLQGDSAVTSMQNRLRSLLNTPSNASASFARLTDVGLQLQRDGTIKVDAAKLTSAVGNLDELKKAFSNSDSVVEANQGFSRRFAVATTQMLDTSGSITTRTEGLRKLMTQNTGDQSRLNDRVDQFQKRLVAQYTAMDSNLSKLTALSNYVTQSLASMNKTSTR